MSNIIKEALEYAFGFNAKGKPCPDLRLIVNALEYIKNQDIKTIEELVRYIREKEYYSMTSPTDFLKDETDCIEAVEKFMANQPCRECEKSSSLLNAYGVTPERAKTVSNGIDVLATRYKKEIEALNYESR